MNDALSKVRDTRYATKALTPEMILESFKTRSLERQNMLMKSTQIMKGFSFERVQEELAGSMTTTKCIEMVKAMIQLENRLHSDLMVNGYLLGKTAKAYQDMFCTGDKDVKWVAFCEEHMKRSPRVVKERYILYFNLCSTYPRFLRVFNTTFSFMCKYASKLRKYLEKNPIEAGKWLETYTDGDLDKEVD